MSVQVNCVNEKKAKAKLKNCPIEVQEYVKALEASNERWKYVNDEALKKIREQAKIISSNPVVMLPLPTDEEIDIVAKANSVLQQGQIYFKHGAKWLRDELAGGNGA